jgi:hypothetical protein
VIGGPGGFGQRYTEIAAWLDKNSIRCEIFGSLGAFHHGLVAVWVEHQGGDAPNVDLRYQNENEDYKPLLRKSTTMQKYQRGLLGR